MTQPTNPTPGDPAPSNEPTNQPAAQPAQPPPGDPADKPLGPAGEKALREEREARKALEKQLAELAPLRQIAAALAGEKEPTGKSEVQLLQERFDAYEKQLADERLARWRAEIAAEKGLPAKLAARLTGSTREELEADADELKAFIPPDKPSTPAPDPTQGARGPVDLDAQIRDAEAKGDVKTAIRLKTQKLYQTQR